MRRAICLASMAIRIFNWEKHDQIEEQLCRVIKNCYWWLEEKIDYEEHGDWVRLYFWKNSGVFDIDARRWGFLELTAFFLSGPFLLGEIKSTSRSKFMSPGAWERRSAGHPQGMYRHRGGRREERGRIYFWKQKLSCMWELLEQRWTRGRTKRALLVHFGAGAQGSKEPCFWGSPLSVEPSVVFILDLFLSPLFCCLNTCPCSWYNSRRARLLMGGVERSW